MRSGLPIDEALPRLRAALADGRNAVLDAPPGAGKSTVVPLALLDEPWARGQKIVLLEPRRLAARAVATRMARRSASGRRHRRLPHAARNARERSDALEVVTEGVFTRMLQSDPALEGVAAVIFDEFHERSLNADLGLALALDAQRHVAPGVARCSSMSATLDGAARREAARRRAGDRAAGRMYPVETHYVGKACRVRPRGPATSRRRVVARACRRALADAAAICSSSCRAPARSGACTTRSRGGPAARRRRAAALRRARRARAGRGARARARRADASRARDQHRRDEPHDRRRARRRRLRASSGAACSIPRPA